MGRTAAACGDQTEPLSSCPVLDAVSGGRGRGRYPRFQPPGLPAHPDPRLIDDCLAAPELGAPDGRYVGVRRPQPLTSSESTRVSLVEGKHFHKVVKHLFYLTPPGNGSWVLLSALITTLFLIKKRLS